MTSSNGNFERSNFLCSLISRISPETRVLTDFTDQTAGIVPERNPVITSVSRVLMLDTAQTPNDPADYSAPSPEESQYEGLYQAF